MGTSLAIVQPAIDPQKAAAFAQKVFDHETGLIVMLLCGIGDRLGLFKDLAARGSATSAELAARTRIDERYAREWLSGLASAGYLEYDPPSRRFNLPPEHAEALAHEGGPMFFGGDFQQLLAIGKILGPLIGAFGRGGGIPLEAYDADWWEGQERFTAGIYENQFLPVWVPAIPDLAAKLEQGARVADLACGGGQLLIKLAQTYPRSRYVGYDVYPPEIARATATAEAAGVGDRVRFEQRDAEEELPESFDVIVTALGAHHASDPRVLLRAIQQALPPDGIYICVEANCSDKLEENLGPMGVMFYGSSLLYCLPTSLAAGGEGLGMAGLPEPTLRALCLEAGFRGFERLAIENPFASLYIVRP